MEQTKGRGRSTEATTLITFGPYGVPGEELTKGLKQCAPDKTLSRQSCLDRINSYLLLFQWECGWYFTKEERVKAKDANWLITNGYVMLLKQGTNWPVLGQYGCPDKIPSSRKITRSYGKKTEIDKTGPRG